MRTYFATDVEDNVCVSYTKGRYADRKYTDGQWRAGQDIKMGVVHEVLLTAQHARIKPHLLRTSSKKVCEAELN